MDKPFPAYQGAEPYIFVSYAHADAEFVYPELVVLRDAGFNVWYDEGISPGSIWRDELAEHLASCSLLLFYISPNSVLSSNCNKEVNFALSKDRPFLNVYLEATSLSPGLEFSLSDVQAIEKFSLSRKDYRGKLAASIHNLMPTDEDTIDDYSVVELLQHSASFSRFKASHQTLGNEVELLLLSENVDSAVATELMGQLRWFAGLQHAGFQRVMAIGLWQQSTYIVLEYCGQNSLDGLLSDNLQVPLEFKIGFCHQVSKILVQLEIDEKFIQNFHPELFAVRKSGEICLRFGALSHAIISDPSDRRYASPEEISGSQLSIESNYYSLGVLMYELLLGRIPYSANVSPEGRATEVTASVDSFVDTPAYVHGGDLQLLLRNIGARNLVKNLLKALVQESPELRRSGFETIPAQGSEKYWSQSYQWVHVKKLFRSRVEAALARITGYWETAGTMDAHDRAKFLMTLYRPIIDTALENKILSGESLTSPEKETYWAVWSEEVITHLKHRQKFVDGIIPEAVYRPIENSLKEWLQQPVCKVIWEAEKNTLEDDEFVSYVDRELMS